MENELTNYKNILENNFTLSCLHHSPIIKVPDVMMKGCEICKEIPTPDECSRICSLIILILKENYPSVYLIPTPLNGDNYLYSLHLKATIDYLSPETQLKNKIILLLAIANAISSLSTGDGKLTKGCR